MEEGQVGGETMGRMGGSQTLETQGLGTARIMGLGKTKTTPDSGNCCYIMCCLFPAICQASHGYCYLSSYLILRRLVFLS